MFSSTLAFRLRARPLSIAVADDVAEIRQLVQGWLTEAGCCVRAAATGRELTRLLHQEHFDIIVTDIIMPEGDGLEVIAEVKRLRPAARVLAISGGGSHLPAGDCLRFAKGLGAHGVLMKPFNREQLLDAVSQVAAALPQPPDAAPAGD